MTEARQATASLYYGTSSPDECGSWWIDTNSTPAAVKVQTDSGPATFVTLGFAGGGTNTYVNTSVPGGNTVGNTVTETALSSSFTMTTAQMVVGSVWRLRLFGVYSTFAVAPTLRGRIKVGSATVLDTGALTTVAGVSNGGWSAETILVVAATGASGSFECQGYAEFSTAATTALSVNVANTAGVTIDTTAPRAVTITVEWSSANAANTITLRQLLVERISAGAL